MKLRGLKTMLGDRIRFYEGFDRLESYNMKFNFDTLGPIMYFQLTT